jgi:hypothetical protein
LHGSPIALLLSVTVLLGSACSSLQTSWQSPRYIPPPEPESLQSSGLCLWLTIDLPFGRESSPSRILVARLPDDVPGTLTSQETWVGNYSPGFVLNIPPGRYVVVGCAVTRSATGQGGMPSAHAYYFPASVVAATETIVQPGRLHFLGELHLDGSSMGTRISDPDAVQSHYKDLVPPGDLHGSSGWSWAMGVHSADFVALDRGPEVRHRFETLADVCFEISDWRSRVTIEEAIPADGSPSDA